jgi:VanZ family protein
MVNFFSKFKIILYCSNFFLILLYLFPGSLLGLIMYNDKKIQPQITSDFIVSSNHCIAFTFISIIGFLSFRKKKEIKLLIFYLIFLSIILEIFHLIIPERSFQWADLLGNLLGVVIVIFINSFINIYEISRK